MSSAEPTFKRIHKGKKATSNVDITITKGLTVQQPQAFNMQGIMEADHKLLVLEVPTREGGKKKTRAGSTLALVRERGPGEHG